MRVYGRAGAAILGGLWFFLGFEPVNFTLCGWTGVACLLLLSVSVRKRAAAAAGVLFGFAFSLPSIPWVFSVMREHGGLRAWQAAGVFLLMVFAWSLFFAAFSVPVAWLSRRGETRALATAPFLWVALEYARTHLPEIGFPWNLLGYPAAENLALSQLAPLTGIYGLSLLVAAHNSLLAGAVLALGRRERRPVMIWAAAAAVLLAAGLIGPRFVPRESPRFIAYLVQPNLPQLPSFPVNWMEHPQIRLDELEQITLDASKKTHGSLIVWPEVPAPFYLSDRRFAERAEHVARESRMPFLLGVVEWERTADGRTKFYNSAVLLDAQGKRAFRYDKIHLVPFGEYVPFRRFLGLAESMVREVGGYQPGTQFTVGQIPDVPGPAEFRQPGPPRKFSVYICYEAVFPDLVRRFTRNGAELLINISNDGWYGRSAAPEQHLAQSRVRAIESRRWMLRATNNGHTVVVDPYGRITARLPADTRTVLTAMFDFRSDLTPYVRFGDWIAWLCIAVGAVFAFVPTKSKA